MTESDDKRFWCIIADGCPQDVDDFSDWNDTLVELLAKLPPEDIARFDFWMDQQTDRAYRRELWRAASLINGGASEDGFYYFRLWLVGMGREVFEAALANPDSLADVVDTDRDYEAELYSVGRHAWQLATGKDPYAEPNEYAPLYDVVAALNRGQRPPELLGEEWPDNDEEYLRRFPKLSALYHLDDEDE